MKILLSVPSLEQGGAERQFAALARGLAGRGHEVLAVSLASTPEAPGPLAGELGAARLVALGKRSRLDGPRVLAALLGLLRRQRPQVHYAFLPSCCVLGGLLTLAAPAVPLVMGVRASELLDLGRAGRLLLGLEARLSARAALVLANSRSGREHLLARGFAAARLRVVENGVDTERFRPDRSLGAALRREWLAGEPGRSEGPLLGLVARLDPLKDHATFLEAAALALRERPELRFVCVGADPLGLLPGLRERAAALGIADRITWAGPRGDMPAVYNALDLLCLSSRSEGLPNVLAEGLACGLPCAVTDAGDSALVAGDAGAVSPPGDAAGLARGMLEMLARKEREGEALAVACRERALARFSLARMVDETEALLAGL